LRTVGVNVGFLDDADRDDLLSSPPGLHDARHRGSGNERLEELDRFRDRFPHIARPKP
jgi:hypothetical protein